MRAHILPVLQLVLLPVCCTATYVWSVLLGHVDAGFPYISDTGTYPPESCVFGLLLAIYANTTAVTVYLRWKQVRVFYAEEESRGLKRANNVSLVLGLLAAFGVLLVANFQETNVIVVHMIGAFLAFVGGTVYTWIQTYISHKAHLLPGHRACLRHFRFVVSLVLTVSLVLVVTFAYMANNKRGDVSQLKKADQKKWGPSDKGFSEHVVSTSMEWVVAFLSAAFFASYYTEFKQFTTSMPLEFKVTFIDVNAKVNGERSSSELHQHETFTVSTVAGSY